MKQKCKEEINPETGGRRARKPYRRSHPARLLAGGQRSGGRAGGACGCEGAVRGGFFYFYIFYFRFLQKYIFVFEIYRNISGRPGPGRSAAGRQKFLCKNFYENICTQDPGGRSPGSGAAGPSGRPAAGRRSD